MHHCKPDTDVYRILNRLEHNSKDSTKTTLYAEKQFSKTTIPNHFIPTLIIIYIYIFIYIYTKCLITYPPYTRDYWTNTWSCPIPSLQTVLLSNSHKLRPHLKNPESDIHHTLYEVSVWLAQKQWKTKVDRDPPTKTCNNPGGNFYWERNTPTPCKFVITIPPIMMDIEKYIGQGTYLVEAYSCSTQPWFWEE